MAADFVRIELAEKTRLKLRFRHKDLRDAVLASNKSVGELFTDSFGGWPYLLLYGLRWFDPKMSLDKASELIEQWVETPDPKTGTARELNDLGHILLEGLKASGFIKIEDAPKDDDASAEGNESPKAAD
jgi:hypothetical protein